MSNDAASSSAPPSVLGYVRETTAAGRPASASTAFRRIAGALVAFGAAVILGLAAYLTPAEAGLGTHEQLNLPACAWVTLMDVPCPTCGMTTAFAHAANGDLLAAGLTQPLGLLLALGTAMALLLGTYVALTGSPIAGMLGRYFTARTAWLLAALALAAWLYKVLSHRGLL